jgi:hypothetical protein
VTPIESTLPAIALLSFIRRKKVTLEIDGLAVVDLAEPEGGTDA